MKVLQRQLLEYTSERSNKFYELSLVYLNRTQGPLANLKVSNYALESRWGKRTGAWKTDQSIGIKKRLRLTRFQHQAENLFRDQLRGKIKKGYVKVRTPKIEKKEKKKESTLEEASLQRFSLIADDL